MITAEVRWGLVPDSAQVVARIFDIEAGVRQVDLSQQYGYEKGRVSHIVRVYPRLKDIKLPMGNFSNHDLVELARVECDAFRYALEDMPVPSPLSAPVA